MLQSYDYFFVCSLYNFDGIFQSMTAEDTTTLLYGKDYLSMLSIQIKDRNTFGETFLDSFIFLSCGLSKLFSILL